MKKQMFAVAVLLISATSFAGYGCKVGQYCPGLPGSGGDTPMSVADVFAIMPSAIVIDCSKACESCGADQVCQCDPGNGFSCVDK